MISAIVCVSRSWGIGKDNHLLFKCKEDMKYFTEKTTGKCVVMGENTFLSLPGQKPLKDRLNIVIAPVGHTYEGCVTVHTMSELLAAIERISETEEVFIIGGGQLYKSMLQYYDRVYVNKLDADPEATVFFPNLDADPSFTLVSAETENLENCKLTYCIYERNFN